MTTPLQSAQLSLTDLIHVSQQFSNEFVAIHDGKLVDHDQNGLALTLCV